MGKRVKKRKLRLDRVFTALTVFVIIIFCMVKLVRFTESKIINNEYYIASNINTISIYSYNEQNSKMDKVNDIYRGQKVKTTGKTKKVNDTNYIEILFEGSKYYANEQNLTKEKKDIVLENQKYVRTSVTIYKKENDSKISSFIKKGNLLQIIDYDYLDNKGNVNMYKIIADSKEGWVYGKYLVDTETEANENYNENKVYDTHKNRKYSYELYGGKASTLDYYPYEKVSFENNPLLKDAKAIYINGSAIKDIDSYIEIATSSGVNAIVLDIKDGALAYPVEVAKEYSMTAYNNAINSFEKYKSAAKKIKDANIYLIGRIVVFNDTHYGKDHPEDCIISPVSSQKWPSAYSRGAWEYNVELALSAIKDMSFNEIQFDYVRFPETSYNMSTNSNTNFKNYYNEEKAEAVQNFLFYATDQIHKAGAYLSVDVFGECSNEYVTSYGQYWPAISNIVDVISSMPYTDHFGRNNDTWTNAYRTVYNWALGAAKRQTEIPTPAIARTWITSYDTPYWNPTVVYNADKISDQAQALVNAGLNGGFITWNSLSSLSKYNQIKSAFSKDYQKNN